MKYSIVADNYSVHFEEYDNILCLEGFYTAKNVEQILGVMKPKWTFIGIHIKGNNTAASGTVKLGGTIVNVDIPAQTIPVAPGSGMLGTLDTVSGQGNVNWWFNNYVISTTAFNNGQLKMKIDNASTFTGTLYIRVFFKMR